MHVSMSNHKSTESNIKNLEVQVGQLPNQLADRPSSSFSVNTEKNLKEECKAIMTRSRMEIQADEGRAEEKVEEYKKQSIAEPALEPVSDLIELEEVVEDKDDQQERRSHFKEKMSLEEAHHHRRPWIRAWRKKEMNEGRGREEHEILCSK